MFVKNRVSVNFCASVTCHNGGLCAQSGAGAWCECQPGFTGLQCDKGDVLKLTTTCVAHSHNYKCCHVKCSSYAALLLFVNFAFDNVHTGALKIILSDLWYLVLFVLHFNQNCLNVNVFIV